jgi:hypothetical protein
MVGKCWNIFGTVCFTGDKLLLGLERLEEEESRGNGNWAGVRKVDSKELAEKDVEMGIQLKIRVLSAWCSDILAGLCKYHRYLPRLRPAPFQRNSYKLMLGCHLLAHLSKNFIATTCSVDVLDGLIFPTVLGEHECPICLQKVELDCERISITLLNNVSCEGVAITSKLCLDYLQVKTEYRALSYTLFRGGVTLQKQSGLLRRYFGKAMCTLGPDATTTYHIFADTAVPD